MYLVESYFRTNSRFGMSISCTDSRFIEIQLPRYSIASDSAEVFSIWYILLSRFLRPAAAKRPNSNKINKDSINILHMTTYAIYIYIGKYTCLPTSLSGSVQVVEFRDHSKEDLSKRFRCERGLLLDYLLRAVEKSTSVRLSQIK